MPAASKLHRAGIHAFVITGRLLKGQALPTFLPTASRIASSALACARGGIAELAVAILDIDYFKTVNDIYGHGTGDLALIHVARLLRAETRTSDIVARSEGEEFVVLMGGLDGRETIATIEHLRLAVEETDFDPKAEGISITLSAGVASYRTGDASFDDILKRSVMHFTVPRRLAGTGLSCGTRQRAHWSGKPCIEMRRFYAAI